MPVEGKVVAPENLKGISWRTGEMECPKCGPVLHVRNCKTESCLLTQQGIAHGHCIMCDEETPIRY